MEYECSIERESLFAQGAEARLYKCKYFGRDALLKERFVKKYRHISLDENLSKERFAAELRAMYKCKSNGIDVPAVYFVFANDHKFIMEWIPDGITVRNYVESLVDNENYKENVKRIGHHMGSVIGKLHSLNIIHGDLTTSNFLLRRDANHIVLIDFGLAEISPSIEKKSVDLFVLEKALISTHNNTEALFASIIDAYQLNNTKEAKNIFAKLEEVRRRGRKRQMFG